MPSQRLPLMELSENDAPSSTANETRRTSRRAVRAPDKFVPGAASTRAGNAKRKRGAEDAAEDVENDIDEEEEEEEEDSEEDDEDDSADEEVERQKRKLAKTPKRPVAKKAKVNGVTSSAVGPTVRLPNRQKKPKKVVIQDVNAEGLFAEIFTSGDSAESVATTWLSRYDADNTASMTNLVNCILQSAGCDLQVTEDDVNDPDNVPSKLNDIQDEYKGKNITDYPLISKAKQSHAFKVSLTDFFEALPGNMHVTGILYDDIALIENIHLWVSTMSSSVLRPFRHTATVVALAVTSSLCKISKDQTESTAKALRQLEGEKKRKKGANKGAIATLEQQIDQGSERRIICESTIKDFFDTVFVHRYRDIDAKIRTDCIEALGHWVITLPSTFLEGTYLRYLGWVLSDISAPTRHEAVKQLEKVLKNTEKIAGIRDFIERFRSRIVEMAVRDSEVSVRVSAIDLLELFREAGMLEPDDIDVIGKLVFDSEPRVRKAVVSFFSENIKDLYESKIEELGGDEALEEVFAGAKDPETPSASWITLKCLAEVLLDYDMDGNEDSQSRTEAGAENEALEASGVESRFFLAAQVLYDKMPEVREWNSIAGYLLFDHSVDVNQKSKTADVQRNLKESFKLDEKEEVVLLEMLDAAVKLALAQSDDSDKSKDKTKKKQTKADAKKAQESIARRLAVILPRLLSKFGANPNTTAVVLRLEQALNLSVFQALRLEETAYPELLHEIGVQFKGHSDQRVLNEASAALLHARQYEELEEITEQSMQSLWDDTIDDLKTRFHSSSKSAQFTARGDLDVDRLSEFASTVTRVSKLASIASPVDRFENNRKGKKSAGSRGAMVPVDILIEIVNRGTLSEADPDIDDIEDELVTAACRSALFYFMWKARSIQEAIAKGEPVADAEIDAIRDRSSSFKTVLFSVLSSRGGLDDLRLLSTGTLLDLHVLFSTLKPTKKSRRRDVEPAEEAIDADQYSYLQTLITEISPTTQEELTAIFVAAEKQYARKARKTLESPADDDAPEDVDSDTDLDADEDVEDVSAVDRQAKTLKTEQKFCELTGKLVLAIMAGVLDAGGPLKGRLRSRIRRNRAKLGPNFKEVVAYLNDAVSSKAAAKKSSTSQKGRGAQEAAAAAATTKKQMKSSELVRDSSDNDADDDEVQIEEGTVEDLRRRELLDEIDDENAEGGGDVGDVGVEEGEDEVMGD